MFKLSVMVSLSVILWSHYICLWINRVCLCYSGRATANQTLDTILHPTFYPWPLQMTSPFPWSHGGYLTSPRIQVGLVTCTGNNHGGNNDWPGLHLSLSCFCSLSLGILPPSQIQLQADLLEDERPSVGELWTTKQVRLPSQDHLMTDPWASPDETRNWRTYQQTFGLISNPNGSYCNPLNFGVKIDNC